MYFKLIAALVCAQLAGSALVAQEYPLEPHRPQIHFSPKQNWMNDPNGMVYHKGNWHLFYQYHPGSTKWGPMHWGHAVSKNLVHWQHRPVALYPDSLGYIFSGSAVLDRTNSSGLGKEGKGPLVAIYTYHDTAGEKAGRKDFQTQGIAYSNDDGITWLKYQGNPVLRNPGIIDFRDPKVMWFAPTQQWVMTLAAKDRIAFYTSPNLKDWSKASDFGAALGAHGGVWECPDLFPVQYKEQQLWALLVNINPGGPNGGSATQYFLGNFDGSRFTPLDTATRWLDYGPDEYAGITWSNTGKRKVFIGWMSNWMYAEAVPTVNWRSAATIPRDLLLRRAQDGWRLASVPAQELSALAAKATLVRRPPVAQAYTLPVRKGAALPCRIDLNMATLGDVQIRFSNDLGEEVLVGYDKVQRQFYVDRTRSGKTGFHKQFATRHYAPRFATGASSDITLVVDVASVELFADGGLSVMTSIFFPNKPFDQVQVQAGAGSLVEWLRYTPLRSIWK